MFFFDKTVSEYIVRICLDTLFQRETSMQDFRRPFEVYFQLYTYYIQGKP